MILKRKISIIGAGSWGTALACAAVRAGHEVMIWGRSAGIVDEINSNRTNSQYLGDLQLPNTLMATHDLAVAACERDIILLCIPTQTLSANLKIMAPMVGDTVFVTCCKGIERQSGKLASQLVEHVFDKHQIAALSGPSFASDVVQDLPTAVTIASSNIDISTRLAEDFSAGNFRCYASDDIKGVELGGALKNVLALAVGAARGMKIGASGEAALITRGFAEISRVAIKLGARQETLMGLSGLGDTVLSCSSPQSRNFTYGMAMGKGESLEGLPLAEGAFTASVADDIAKQQDLDVPIIDAVVKVLEKQVTAREAVEELLNRPLKNETND